MPLYRIQAPDGKSYQIEGPPGASQQDVIAAVLSQNPNAGVAPSARPTGGIMSGFGSGLESLLSSGRTGLGAAFGNANEAAQAGLERQEEIGKKYLPSTDFEKVEDIYHKRGIFPAAWEAVKQAPAAIAEQAPNIGATLGGARLGAMAGSAVAPGVGTVVGGLLGAAVPSLLQQFGGNVERQAQEQQNAGQPLDINTGRAFAAAVPQAALDVASEAIPLGGSLVSKLTGIPLNALTKGGAGVKRLADESLLKTLAKGTATGALAEIPTEVAQQMLERAQAGLSLTDADALKEYGQTAYQVGLLAPLGAAGRLSERSEARANLAAQQQQQQQAQVPPEQEQLLQLGYTPPTPPAATSELGTAPSVLDMMDEHKELRDQHNSLTDQIAAAGAANDHETTNQLVQQHAAVGKRIDSLAKQIAMAGGIAPTTEQMKSEATDTPEKILALAQNQVAAIDKQIEYHQDALRKATDKNVQDYAAVPAITAKIQDLVTQKNQLLDDIKNRQHVVNTAATPKGETVDMFGRPEQPAALALEQVSALQPEDNQTGDLFSQENMRKNQVRNSAYDLSQAVKGTTDQDVANAFALGMSNPKPASFRPEGLRAEITPTEKEAEVIPDNSLHAKATEAARQLSEERLELPGRKRSLSATNEQFDAADEQMTALKNSIEKPQGNSAKSVVEQMQELGQAHDAIQNQLNAGKASLTTAEKAQLLNSQLGKGKPPAPRPMTDMEKNKLKKEQAKILASYNKLLTKVTETRDQIENLRRSLYTTKEVEAQGVTEERQRKSLIKAPTEKQAEEGIKGRAVKSRAVQTAARINRGDVAKEAAASDLMRGIAHANGVESDEYQKFMADRNKEIAKLKKKDPQAASSLRAQTTYDAYEKAIELGEKTKNYQEALNHAVERMQKALAESGTTQTVASKRTAQETRKVSSAKKEERTGSPESRAASNARNEFIAGTRATPEQIRHLQSAPENEEERARRETREANRLAKQYRGTTRAQGEEDTLYTPRENLHGNEYSKDTRTPLSEEHQEQLANKDIVGVLEDLAKTSKSPLIRESATRLSKLVGKTKIQLVSELKLDGKSVPALYDSAIDTIKFHPDGLTEEDLVHEAEHAATIKNLSVPDDALTKEQLNARNEINAIFNKLKSKGVLTGEYAAENVKEFVAEVRSNEGLRERLKNEPWFSGSMLQRLFTAFKRLLGFNTESAVEAADRHIKALEAESEKFEKPKKTTETNSPEFKSWFQDSKVVDEKGDPLVLYHGTSSEKIESFDPSRRGESGHAALGPGFYAGEKNYAADYNGDSTKSLIPLYARIEHPLYFDDEGFATQTKEADEANMTAYNKVKAVDPKLANDVFRLENGRVAAFNTFKVARDATGKAYRDTKQFEKAMDIAGIDGVIDKYPRGVHQVMVRDNKQFKHATENIGKYDVSNPNIYASVFRTNNAVKGIGSSIIGKERGAFENFKDNLLGLRGRVQLVDRHAALSEALKKGLSKGQISSLEAQNAEFLLRFGEHRSQYTAQFLTNGPVQLVKNKTAQGTETVYKSTKGANMLDVAKAFGESKLGDDKQIEAMATLYLAGRRAQQVGWDKLNFEDPTAVKNDYANLMKVLDGNKAAKEAFEKGADIYKNYNAGLLDWLVQTEAMTKQKADELKSYNYVPYYRVGKDGDVELFVDKERRVKIGNIKDEPQLKELIGGSDHIMPVFSSAIQNTMLLTNMGLRNKSVKESAMMLNKLGIASRVAPGDGPANPSVVRFRINGERHHAVIDTDMYGIPADLIVKGMEGIKTAIPVAVKMLGYPADILRKFVTRNPAYALRQVVRDPLNAWLTTGTDATPVLASMKELSKMVAGRSPAERALMESGAISSNVITGGKEDMARMLRDITAGKNGWEKLLAKADAFAMQGDAATRAVIYQDSLKKGLSEQQALLRTLESMNFGRHGLSPSMQVISTIVPFFNAQIQGLDVLYRAFKGDMPFNEQLKIKQKLWSRGMMLALGTMAYASMMQDDEGYKNAKPEERLGNWFIPIPGQKDMLKVPIPFELGYLFKTLPEAMMNASAGDREASQAVLGMGRLLAQSNPFSLPQAIKPATEVALGRSFFSGDIESQAEKKQLPGERARGSTTELSKAVGHTLGVSPIVLDYLIRGYTGSLGIAITQLANPILAPDTKAAVAQPTANLSQMPFIGNLFQPVEGRGTLDEAYAMMTQIQQAKGTYNKMLEEGRRADAQAFAQNYATQLSMATTSGSAEKFLGNIAKQERMVRASPTMTTEQKDAKLEQLQKAQQQYAERFIAFAEKRAHQ